MTCEDQVVILLSIKTRNFPFQKGLRREIHFVFGLKYLLLNIKQINKKVKVT